MRFLQQLQNDCWAESSLGDNVQAPLQDRQRNAATTSDYRDGCTRNQLNQMCAGFQDHEHRAAFALIKPGCRRRTATKLIRISGRDCVGKYNAQAGTRIALRYASAGLSLSVHVFYTQT